MAAIAAADDDPVLLAELARVNPHDFRDFLSESNEFESREALQLLKAAEYLSYSKSAPKLNLDSLTFLLVGAGIGAILGLLLAPTLGEELRANIAGATRRGIDRSREAARQLGRRRGEDYQVTREREAELYSRAAKAAEDLARSANTVTTAVEGGRQAYLEEKRKAELSGRSDVAPSQPTHGSN